MSMNPAGWGMRHKAALVFLIAIFVMWQPHLSTSSAETAETEVTLYVHTDPSATSFGGRVLSLSSNAKSRQSGDVRDCLEFTLVPSLSSQLRVLGVSAYVWLVSRESVRGTLQVAISEVTANGSVRVITSSSVTNLGIPAYQYQVVFGLGPLNHALAAGSTIRFSVCFSPVRQVPVLLLWDDPLTQTRLVLQVQSVPKIDLEITDIHGKVSTIFPENESDLTTLIARASIEDPFGGTNIRCVSLIVQNSTGSIVIKDASIITCLTCRVEFPFRLSCTLPFTVPAGTFNVTVLVRDVAGRIFKETRPVSVTRFHTLTLQMVDLQKKPLPNLNVSIWAQGQLIDNRTTNSNGTTIFRVPSSEDFPGSVGPIKVQVRKAWLLIPTQINVDADTWEQIVVYVCDWNILVRLKDLSLPVPGAKIDLYFNGTEPPIGSATTDANGVAHFTAMPLGAYEVAISSFLGPRSVNRTCSCEVLTVVEIFLFDTTVLMLAVVAVVLFLVVVLWWRQRRRTRHFKHVAELFGGTLPRSAIMMIFGPSGSGKSLLLQNLLVDSLASGRHCVYISNSELPSNIKDRLAKMRVDIQKHQDEKTFRLVDAYSGGTGAVSSEEHWVASPRDLTALGIQLTSCLEEVGGVGDVFFDSVGPIVAAGDSVQAFNFVEYYGARVAKVGGTFLYVAGATIEDNLLSRFEEASDCVLQTERYVGPGKIRGRLLVKKARGLDHQRDWVGFKIAPSGRMEFVPLPAQRPSEA